MYGHSPTCTAHRADERKCRIVLERECLRRDPVRFAGAIFKQKQRVSVRNLTKYFTTSAARDSRLTPDASAIAGSNGVTTFALDNFAARRVLELTVDIEALWWPGVEMERLPESDRGWTANVGRVQTTLEGKSNADESVAATG